MSNKNYKSNIPNQISKAIWDQYLSNNFIDNYSQTNVLPKKPPEFDDRMFHYQNEISRLKSKLSRLKSKLNIAEAKVADAQNFLREVEGKKFYRVERKSNKNRAIKFYTSLVKAICARGVTKKGFNSNMPNAEDYEVVEYELVKLNTIPLEEAAANYRHGTKMAR
jgi:hypothetical protein